MGRVTRYVTGALVLVVLAATAHALGNGPVLGGQGRAWSAGGGVFLPPQWAAASPGYVDGTADDGANGVRFRVIAEDVGVHGGGFALDSTDEFGASMEAFKVLAPDVLLGTGGQMSVSSTVSLNLETVPNGILLSSLDMTDGASNSCERISCNSSDAVHTLVGGGDRVFDQTNYVTGKLRVASNGAVGVDANAVLYVTGGSTEISTSAVTHRFKNHTAYTGSELFSTTFACQTTSATPLTCTSWGLGVVDNPSCSVMVRIAARIDGASNTARAAYVIAANVYRAGGNAVIQGQTAVSTIESAAAWDAVLGINGTAFTVSVTGAAATTIDWVGSMELQCVQDDA